MGKRPDVRKVVAVLGVVLAAALLPIATSPSGAAAAPPAAPPAAHDHSSHSLPDGPAVLEGRLSVWHGDRDPAPTETGVELDVSGHVVPVAMSYDAAMAYAGRSVRITGRIASGRLVPDAGTTPEVLAPGPATVVTAAATTRTVVVILVNFTDNTSMPWTPTSVENTVLDANRDNPNSVRAFYEESSDEAVTISGAVFGWYPIAYSQSVCDYRGWAAAARTAAAADALAAGYDLNSTSVTKVYAFPNTTGCTWAGLGELPGDESWIDGSMTLRTVAHELGHNFGAHHASTMTCRDATNARITSTARRTDDCTSSEYGDPFSLMGSASTRTHHAWQRIQTTHPVVSQTVTLSAGYDATHTISRLEPGTGSTATRLLRIVRPNVTGGETGTFLDIEVRGSTTSFDTFASTDPAVTGVSVRIGYANTVRRQSQLLDATLGTTGFGDAPLQTGSSIWDPLSGAQVTLVGTTASDATVRVRHDPDLSAPTAVAGLTGTPSGSTTPAVTLAWSAATDDRQLAGYEIRRAGTRIAVAKALSFTDSCAGVTTCALTPGASVTYGVVGYDASGKVGPVTSVTVTIPNTDTVAPGQVTGVTDTDRTATSNTLSWTAAVDNAGGSGIGGYEVLRNGTVVATTGATATTWTGTGLAASTAYTYTVRAFDAQQNRGAESAPVTVTTEPAPLDPSGVTTTSTARATATISFTGGDPYASYEVRRELRSSKGVWGSAVTVATVSSCPTTCTVTNTVTKSGTYRYSVRAVNGTLATAWVLGTQVSLSTRA